MSEIKKLIQKRIGLTGWASEGDLTGMDKQIASRLATLERVANVAVKFWKMNRPIGWSEKEHLDNPEINATSDAEKALCRAVAEFLKEPPNAQH